MSEIDFKEVITLQNAGVVVLQAIRNNNNNNDILDFKWVYMNPAAEKINNITLKELSNTTFLQIVPDSHSRFENLKKLVEQDGFLTEEIFSPSLKKWLFISARKYGDGCIANIEDITDKKLIEEQNKNNEKLFATLFDSSGVAIALVDRNEKVVRANKTACEMFGYEKHEVIGIKLQQVYPPEQEDNGFQQYVDLINRKIKSYQIEKQYIRKDGSLFWACLTVSLFEEAGDEAFAIGVIEDIDKRKKAENALNILVKELTDLNTYKDKVLTIIAHDLKSPVSSSVNFFEYLFDVFEDLPKEELKELLKKFQKNILNISGLLDGLMIWVQNQLNKVVLKRTSIEIEKELQVVIEACRQQAEEKNITIVSSFNGPSTAIADLNMFSAINRNLLTNAIKFSPENAEINIQTAFKDNNALISYIDQGSGMTPETIKNIQEGNYISATFGTKGEKGSGLGLSLCKDFIEKNNGSFFITSEPNAGSNFSYTLPLSL